MINFAHNGETLILFLKGLGKPVNVKPSDRNYKKVLKGLEDNISDEEMKSLVLASQESETVVQENYVEEVRKSGVDVQYKDGNVYLNGSILHNGLADRIKDFANRDLPFQHLLKFIANIEENPSKRAKEETPKFLEHKDLPITEDGYLLAYKRVTADYKDCRTGKIDNKIGAKPSMPRNMVDDDYGLNCAEGLHCGSMKYVGGFKVQSGPVMIVKIHPKDIVCVPKDESCQKVRVCDYEVIGEMEEIFEEPLYTSDAKPVTQSYSPDWNKIDENYQDDYDDESDVEESYDEEYEEDIDDYSDEEELEWDDEDDEDDYDEEEPMDYVGNLDKDEPEYPEPQDIL